MRQAVERSSSVQRDALITLVGEVDQQGIDTLADLLIAAARQRSTDCSDEDAIDGTGQDDEKKGIAEGSREWRRSR